MAPKRKKTLLKSAEMFAGSATEIPDSDLPTYGDVARYLYRVQETERDFNAQIHVVTERIIEVWNKCNPKLPLKQGKVLNVQVRRFLQKVKQFNVRKLSSGRSINLEKIKDKLFDIAACSCALPMLSCDSQYVRCDGKNCSKKYIVCECPVERRVPAAKREYILDQRSKTGTKGRFHMGAVDRKAAAAASTSGTPRMQQRIEHIVLNPDMSFEVISKDAPDIRPDTRLPCRISGKAGHRISG
jgi:hypothetical protein